MQMIWYCFVPFSVNRITGLPRTADILTVEKSNYLFMLISRKKQTSSAPNLTPGNTVVEQVHHFKYLGVTFTSVLKQGKRLVYYITDFISILTVAVFSFYTSC